MSDKELIHSLVKEIHRKMYKESWRNMGRITSAAGFAHLYALYDDMTDYTADHWFYNNKQNIFQFTGVKERTGSSMYKRRADEPASWLFSGMIEQLACEEEECLDAEWRKELQRDVELFITPHLDVNTDTYLLTPEETDAFKQKLDAIKEIEMMLAVLILLTLPGPLFDMNLLRYANLDTPRQMFITNNTVTIQDGDGKFRYLPWVVGELVVRYLTVFRPLQQLLARNFDMPEKHRMNHYFLAYYYTDKELDLLCAEMMKMQGLEVETFTDWRRQFVQKHSAKFDKRYEKWAARTKLPEQEVIDQIHQRFEQKSGLHEIGVQFYLADFGRSTMLPFNSRQPSSQC